MAVEDVLITTTESVNELAIRLGSLGRWMQALGLVVVLWILVQIIHFFFTLKRMRKLSSIDERLERIEGKLGKKK